MRRLMGRIADFLEAALEICVFLVCGMSALLFSVAAIGILYDMYQRLAQAI